jgi:hypothetical protein
MIGAGGSSSPPKMADMAVLLNVPNVRRQHWRLAC